MPSREESELVEKLNVPVLTTWKAIDFLPENHPLYVGRPGLIAQRGANFSQQNSDLFISIGTSGNVYPAAGFVQEARMSGAHTVELNLEPSQGASMFAEHHHGKATEIVPEYLKMIT